MSAPSDLSTDESGWVGGLPVVDPDADAAVDLELAVDPDTGRLQELEGAPGWSRQLLARRNTGSGFVPIRIKLQSDLADGAWTSNSRIDSAWRLEAGVVARSRLLRLPPTSFCTNQRVLFRTVCPKTGRPMRTCSDVERLTAAGIPTYESTAVRAVGADGDAPLFVLEGGNGAGGAGEDWEDVYGGYEAVLDEPCAALPCRACEYRTECFTRDADGRMPAQDRLQPLNVFDAYALVADAPMIELADTVAVLGAATAADRVADRDVADALDGEGGWVVPGCVGLGGDSSGTPVAGALGREVAFVKVRSFKRLIDDLRRTARADGVVLDESLQIHGALPTADAEPARWGVDFRWATCGPLVGGPLGQEAVARQGRLAGELGHLLARLLAENDGRSAEQLRALVDEAADEVWRRWKPELGSSDVSWLGPAFVARTRIEPSALMFRGDHRELLRDPPLVAAEPWSDLWTVVLRLVVGAHDGGFVTPADPEMWLDAVAEALKPLLMQLRSEAFGRSVRAEELSAVTQAMIESGPKAPPKVEVLRVAMRPMDESQGSVVHEVVCRPGAVISFGRAPGNQVVIPDKQVSSRHGRIEMRSDGDVWVVDDNSLNGTFLGEHRVGVDGVPVAGDATIQVGEYLLDLMRCEDELTVIDGGSRDPSATLQSFSFEGVTDRIVAELMRRHARASGQGSGVRAAAVRAYIERELGGLEPSQLQDVHQQLVESSGGGGGDGAETAIWQSLTEKLLPGQRPPTGARDVELAVELLAQVVEVAIAWTRQALAGRSEFADEFGAEVTMVFRRDPNPLKGCRTEDMLAYLLDWSAEESAAVRREHLEAVFRDLAQHQLGLLAGVRDAVVAVVDRIAPERIMEDLEKAGMFASKEKRAWLTYERLYRDLLEERNKLFEDVISPALQRGYLTHHDDAQDAPSEPEA